MSYEFEEDVVRPEFPQGQPGVIRIYPTVGGVRVEADLGRPIVWDVADRSSTGIASGTITTPANVVFDGQNVHRFDVPIPGISELEEDYRLKVTWTPAGDIVPKVELVLFDVVLAPLGDSVSLSDLKEERPDVGHELELMGIRLGANPGTEAEILATRVLAKKARGQLFAWLRGTGRQRPRPFQIIERRPLNRVERLIALRFLYEGVTKDPEAGESGRDALFRHYRDESRSTLESLHLVYTIDEDLDPDAVAEGIGNTFPIRRVQS